ncbi:MAG TPA: hypothetical protein VF665_04870, partial [Longimicrobium sp.]|uniref:hypothetical protein n=1 Tax=Longimicrobium sp. TaxID=2029185 RepID=UPI002EDA7B92
MARSRTVRLVSWGLGGLLLGIGLAVLALNIVARAPRGHKFVLDRTLDALGKNVDGGRLIVARINGNLFEGAKVYGLRLQDNQGRAFVVADSAYLDYDVRTLLSPRIHITRATLYNPEIYVFKLPGDTLWNYQAIFADTSSVKRAPGVERATLLDTIRVVNGLVRVQLPWRPDSTLSRRAQRAEIRDALSNSSQILVDSVRGGFIRTMNFTAMNGRLSRVRFSPGTRTGSRIHVDSLRTEAQIYRRPAHLVHGEAVVALLKAHIELDAPVVRLRRSVLSVSGVVRTDSFPEWFPEAQAPMYDLAFRGDSLDFEDLQWLYPRFPGTATGGLSLRIESRPGGTMFLARDTDVRAPGTRLRGSFG